MIDFVQESGDRARVEILVDEAHTFVLQAYEDDLPVALDSSATKVQVQKPGGTDLVAKTNTGVTVAAGDDGSTANKVSYTLTAALNDTEDENFIYTVYAVRNGETEEHERRVLFDVVQSILYNTVREEDLFAIAPGLGEDRAHRVAGTANASGGSTTTLVDDELKRYPDDWFNGGVIELLDGADKGEERDVTDFARSTGTVTFSPAISATPDGDAYRLRRSWAHLIDRAFESVKWRVRARGNRPALIIDAGELHIPVMYHAAQLCYEALGSYRNEDPIEGATWNIAKEFEQRYDRAFNAIPFAYDTTEDAVPDTELSMGSVKMSRR